VTANNAYIVEILQTAGHINPAEGQSALKAAQASQCNVLDPLAEAGYSKAELFNQLAQYCGMETIALAGATLTPESLRGDVARRYGIIPIRKDADTLVIAIGDPLDIQTLDTLRYLLKHPIEVMAALPEEIEKALDRLYPQTADPDFFEPSEEAPVVLKETEDDEPVIRLVNLLISEGFRARASDIHLEPLNEHFRVRYRIDGVLQEVDGPPRRLHPTVISRIKIMAKMNIAEKRLPQDGRIEIRVVGHDLDLRVSTIPTNHGESIVMRILDKQSLLPGLEHLGFSHDNRQTFERLITRPDGILLVTGPTGSGKTTTLYACLNHLNHPGRKIITVEDPVEYQLGGINQVQVQPRIGLTFSAALRSILRQAPNIIMIGEIRDRETAEIAVNSALTGHLVLSTLHTNDAPSAITRLIDIGVKPFLIASSVRAIMAQRLVRTLCGECGGDGCLTCGHSGFSGRKGIFELLSVNDEIRQMIHDGASTPALRAKARTLGMDTLREDGLRKVEEGLTTLNEVLRTTLGDDE